MAPQHSSLKYATREMSPLTYDYYQNILARILISRDNGWRNPFVNQQIMYTSVKSCIHLSNHVCICQIKTFTPDLKISSKKNPKRYIMLKSFRQVELHLRIYWYNRRHYWKNRSNENIDFRTDIVCITKLMNRSSIPVILHWIWDRHKMTQWLNLVLPWHDDIHAVRVYHTWPLLHAIDRF